MSAQNHRIMSAFARNSICEHCSTHFNTHVDCYQCEPDSDYCERWGDDAGDLCENWMGCDIAADVAGKLSSLGFAKTLIDEVKFEATSVIPERRGRLAHVWLVRAVLEAFWRLGETITMKYACLMVHRYLPANAKSFKTTPFPQNQADARKFYADFRVLRWKLAAELECTCKKKPSKKKPSKTMSQTTMQVARPGYKCHCYSGGNGCPHM